MKVITACAECAYYNKRKHKCTRGAMVEGKSTARFFADCPLEEASPRGRGCWEKHPQVNTTLVCSECHYSVCFYEAELFNYCPFCGVLIERKDGTDNA